MSHATKKISITNNFKISKIIGNIVQIIIPEWKIIMCNLSIKTLRSTLITCRFIPIDLFEQNRASIEKYMFSRDLEEDIN